MNSKKAIKLKKYRIKKEFSIWSGNKFCEDEVVYEYPYYTYGCLDSDEIAISVRPGQTPFFGIPRENLEEVGTTEYKENAFDDKSCKYFLQHFDRGDINVCESCNPEYILLRCWDDDSQTTQVLTPAEARKVASWLNRLADVVDAKGEEEE